jgi:hypothetical protein
MRLGHALRHGRWLPLLLAGSIGYLLGDWHAVVLRSAELSAAQNIALRFPEANADGVDAVADATGGTGTAVLGATQVALLSPNPMVSPRQASQALVQVASAEVVMPLPRVETAPARPAITARPKAEAKPVIAQPKAEPKSTADIRHANRAGFVLNDAQIASIKGRLHLSPDQEQMWPAVEAALRNIAYAKTRDVHRHGGAAATDVASLDPDSAEVQGLKSAAFPLLMSFSDEQRSEVRSLAHVMGLDKLASEL